MLTQVNVSMSISCHFDGIDYEKKPLLHCPSVYAIDLSSENTEQ